MANEINIKIKTTFDEKGAKRFRNSLKSFAKGPALGAAKAGVAGVGAAAIVAFGTATKAALDFGEETNAAMSDLQRTTGATAGEMEAFRRRSLEIFGGGFGQSIEDVAEAMALVRNNTGESGKALEDLTRQALVMRDRFDLDIGESIDGAKILMDEFGLSSEQAFDLIVTGTQKGLNRSGDLLDTIREYGNLFGDAGFDAAEFFSLLETGTQGGVLSGVARRGRGHDLSI